MTNAKGVLEWMDWKNREKELKANMTKEEYIRSCSFDELAEFLTKVILSDRRFRMTRIGGVEETKAWLKEKHE